MFIQKFFIEVCVESRKCNTHALRKTCRENGRRRGPPEKLAHYNTIKQLGKNFQLSDMLITRAIGINKNLIRSSRGIRFNSTMLELTWVDYFKFKKQSNRINVASSVVTGAVGGLITLNTLGNIELDLEKQIMGFDPLMVMGGAVIIGGGFGYLLGPFIGKPLFNVINKRAIEQFKVKDQVFLQRVKNNRVDPTSQSFSNPVPDYYGERIYSLNDYKQWLRDCNAFRRKSKEFL